MSLNKVKIELSSRQVDLLLRYGYAFEDEEKQLKKFSEKSDEWHVLVSDDFYAPRLIGDLVYSAKKISNESVLDELDEVCDVIEASMMIASGKFKTFPL